MATILHPDMTSPTIGQYLRSCKKRLHCTTVNTLYLTFLRAYSLLVVILEIGRAYGRAYVRKSKWYGNVLCMNAEVVTKQQKKKKQQGTGSILKHCVWISKR